MRNQTEFQRKEHFLSFHSVPSTLQTASHFIVLRCCPGRYCLGATPSTTATHSTAEGSYIHLVGGDGWN